MDREEELRQWFSHANNDLILAQHGLSLRPTPDEPISCLSQQAAEKYLKAFLFFNHIEPPKTHDLPTLLEMCVKISPEFTDLSKKCFFLNRFAVAPRYPNELQITGEDARICVKYAKEIEKFVLEKVK